MPLIKYKINSDGTKFKHTYALKIFISDLLIKQLNDSVNLVPFSID